MVRDLVGEGGDSGKGYLLYFELTLVVVTVRPLTFSVRHLNAIKSTAGRSFLGIKPLPTLEQM
jgi:hypothetical protein